jgi:hypothetical protein
MIVPSIEYICWYYVPQICSLGRVQRLVFMQIIQLQDEINFLRIKILDISSPFCLNLVLLVPVELVYNWISSVVSKTTLLILARWFFSSYRYQFGFLGSNLHFFCVEHFYAQEPDARVFQCTKTPTVERQRHHQNSVTPFPSFLPSPHSLIACSLPRSPDPLSLACPPFPRRTGEGPQDCPSTDRRSPAAAGQWGGVGRQQWRRRRWRRRSVAGSPHHKTHGRGSGAAGRSPCGASGSSCLPAWVRPQWRSSSFYTQIWNASLCMMERPSVNIHTGMNFGY